IITTMAFMLYDFARDYTGRGNPRSDALTDAGRQRARTIVMTTIAMCGGMLPSALALDSGGEFRSPMAIAVIGGLISSTLLSLVFVPAVFVLIDELGDWLWRQFSRFIGTPDEPENDPAASAREPKPSAAAKPLNDAEPQHELPLMTPQAAE